MAAAWPAKPEATDLLMVTARVALAAPRVKAAPGVPAVKIIVAPTWAGSPGASGRWASAVRAEKLQRTALLETAAAEAEDTTAAGVEAVALATTRTDTTAMAAAAEEDRRTSSPAPSSPHVDGLEERG
jgi:hypothetical protein